MEGLTLGKMVRLTFENLPIIIRDNATNEKLLEGFVKDIPLEMCSYKIKWVDEAHTTPVKYIIKVEVTE